VGTPVMQDATNARRLLLGLLKRRRPFTSSTQQTR
jgi:hypothetical protein